MSRSQVAVVLSGCGVFDGSEIHEAVFSLLSLARHGLSVQCFAPNVPQMHVINHVTGKVAEGETRNVLVEAARIARGEIKGLNDFDPHQYDAVVFPGGFGAAKNLSRFAVDGPTATVEDSVVRCVRGVHAARKPIVALCISPVLLASVLDGVTVTVGNDPVAARSIRDMGAVHVEAKVDEPVIDMNNRIVTVPCYMLDAPIEKIAGAVENAVLALIEMMVSLKESVKA